MKALQSTKKIPVQINGKSYESLGKAAMALSNKTNKKIHPEQIRRAIKDESNIEGVEISEPDGPVFDKLCKDYFELVCKEFNQKLNPPLLRYPPGKRPIDLGIPEQWR